MPMLLLCLHLCLAAIHVDEIPDDEVLQIFDQKYYQVDLASGEKTYLYRLFRPLQRAPSTKYPLIVWLHGYGDVEFEKIGFGHLKHTGAIFQSAEQAKQLDFYFLAVQCPIDQPGFFRNVVSVATVSKPSEDIPQPGEIVVRLINDLIDEESIDANRITLVGISGAGGACLEMAMRYPDRFAGMAILGSSGGDHTRVGSLKDTPVWAFHATEDPDVPVRDIARTIDAINSAGGKANLTFIEGNFHNCWGIAFRDHGLLAWLLGQERGNFLAPKPGRDPSSRWQLMVFLAVVIGFGVVVAVEIRRRLRRSAIEQGRCRSVEPTCS